MSRRGLVWLIAAAVAAAIGLVVRLWLALAGRPDYIGAAFRGGPFIKLALIVGGSLAALGLIAAAMFRSGRASRAARRVNVAADTDGTAVMEFALLFPIAMGVVLIMVQSMLMMSATVGVNYAAFAASRTAIVWIPKDLSGQALAGYDPEPENVVAGPPRSFKLRMIHAAAAIACVPISGTTTAGGGSSSDAPAVAGTVSQYFTASGATPPNWVSKLLGGQFNYAWTHTSVVLEDWEDTPNTYGENQDITVLVHHDFNLTMPFAKALFSQSSDGGEYFSTITARCTLLNEGVSDVIKEDNFPAKPAGP